MLMFSQALRLHKMSYHNKNGFIYEKNYGRIFFWTNKTIIFFYSIIVIVKNLILN